MIGASDAQGWPAPESAGLNAMDRERAASLADEGGASAAAFESASAAAFESRDSKPSIVRPGNGWRIAAFALGVLAAWRMARPERRRRLGEREMKEAWTAVLSNRPIPGSSPDVRKKRRRSPGSPDKESRRHPETPAFDENCDTPARPLPAVGRHERGEDESARFER